MTASKISRAFHIYLPNVECTNILRRILISLTVLIDIYKHFQPYFHFLRHNYNRHICYANRKYNPHRCSYRQATDSSCVSSTLLYMIFFPFETRKKGVDEKHATKHFTHLGLPYQNYRLHVLLTHFQPTTLFDAPGKQAF